MRAPARPPPAPPTVNTHSSGGHDTERAPTSLQLHDSVPVSTACLQHSRHACVYEAHAVHAVAGNLCEVATPLKRHALVSIYEPA